MTLSQRTRDFLKRAVEAHLISHKEKEKIMKATSARSKIHELGERIAPHKKRKGRSNTLAAKAFRYAKSHNVSLKSAWREVKRGLED